MQQFCYSGKKFKEDCKDQSLAVIILGFGGLFLILWFEWAPKPFRILSDPRVFAYLRIIIGCDHWIGSLVGVLMWSGWCDPGVHC